MTTAELRTVTIIRLIVIMAIVMTIVLLVYLYLFVCIRQDVIVVSPLFSI